MPSNFEKDFEEFNGEFTNLKYFKEWIKDDGYPYDEDICKWIITEIKAGREIYGESFAGIYYAFFEFYKAMKKRKKT